MSRYLETSDELADDMAACLKGLRGYFMQIAEEHPDMDTSAIDDLLKRHRALREGE
jgi:hypothetical protein